MGSDYERLNGDLPRWPSLTSVRSLDMSFCFGIRRFSPLESLLPMLKRLVLVGCNFDELPPEVCGESYSRLRGEPFDEKNVFSTHGIQLNDMPSHSKVSLNQCG